MEHNKTLKGNPYEFPATFNLHIRGEKEAYKNELESIF